MNKFSATIFFLCSVFSNISAQTPFFETYVLLKKNEQVNINKIFQDKTGFIWYGTNKGLFKFNGKTFRRFTVADSLPDERITAIAEDSLHRIWIGMQNGGIRYLEDGKFRKFESAEGPVRQPVSKILFDAHGTLWFSTLSDGIYFFRRNRLNRIDESDGMPDLYVYDMAEDASGRIWAGTDGGVVICTAGDTVSLSLLDYKHGLPDNIIKKVSIAPDGRVWMITDNSGIIIYDTKQKNYQPLVSKGWQFGGITDFVVDGMNVWISAAQSGLILYDQQKAKTRLYNSTDVRGISTINTLLKDREGNIWAGSKIGALRTLGDCIEYLEVSSLSVAMNAEAVAVDLSGDLWWAGREGLFRRTTTQAGKEKIDRKFRGTPYDNLTITSLYVDKQNYLWVGFYGEGAVRMDLASGAIIHFGKELLNGNILNITGKGDDVWLATLEGATRITAHAPFPTVKNFSSRDGLSSDYIYQVFIDTKNRIWFATDGKGADMMDSSGFHHYQDGLGSKIVYGFAEDGKKRIWANASDGLYVLEGNKFKPLGQDKGLRDNSISCMMSTSNGDILIMHDLGIDLLNVQQDRIRYVGDEGAMKDKLPNLNTTARDTDGKVYLGTSHGIVIYSGLQDRGKAVPIPVIDTVRVFDKTIDPSAALDLPHNRNFISIDYVGLWFQDPEGLYYQTKLENFDRDWITRRDHSATYSNLPPGDYMFRLKVSDTRDFAFAREATLLINIAQPFWKTSWFYIFSIIAVTGLGYAFVKNREQQLLEDKRALETKVQERTVEIQTKNEEIQAQNEEIHSQAEEIKGINENLELLVKERTLELLKKNKALEEYAFITAHNLRAPVASVLGLINLASRLELDEESKILISHLQASAEKLDAIVRSITAAIEKAE